MFLHGNSLPKKSNRPLLWSSPTSTLTQERSLTQFTKTVLLSASLKCHALMPKLQINFTVSTSLNHTSVSWAPSCKVMFALAWKSWQMVPLTSGETLLDPLTQFKLKCMPQGLWEHLTVPIACEMQFTDLTQHKIRLLKLINSLAETCQQLLSSQIAHAALSNHTLSNRVSLDKLSTLFLKRDLKFLLCKCLILTSPLLKNSLKSTKDCFQNLLHWLNIWQQAHVWLWKCVKRTLFKSSVSFADLWTQKSLKTLDLTLCVQNSVRAVYSTVYTAVICPKMALSNANTSSQSNKSNEQNGLCF